MRIGIAGPVEIESLSEYLPHPQGCLPWGLGGTLPTALIRGLVERGHEVSVYTLSPAVSRDYVFGDGGLRLFVGPYRNRARSRAKDFFRVERRAIARFVGGDDADVINAHWTYEFALGALKARSDTIVTVRDWAPTIFKLERTGYRMTRLLMNKACLAKSRHLLCPSPYIQALLESVGCYAEVIPNMVAREATRQAGAREPRGASALICVSNGFAGWKNVATLLRAFPIIRREMPDASLRLVGHELGEGEAAQKWAAENGLDSGVQFIGHVPRDQVYKEMLSSDVLVHPSLEESFGCVLVEAMAIGLPVIGGRDSGAVPWVLDYGDAGLLVDVTKPPSIAEAVLTLAAKPGVREYLRSQGLARVANYFSERAVVESYLAAYERVARS